MLLLEPLRCTPPGKRLSIEHFAFFHEFRLRAVIGSQQRPLRISFGAHGRLSGGGHSVPVPPPPLLYIGWVGVG